MPPQEQADLWMSLRDRMKTDWKELTMQEKKAGAYTLSTRNTDAGCYLRPVLFSRGGIRVCPRQLMQPKQNLLEASPTC